MGEWSWKARLAGEYTKILSLSSLFFQTLGGKTGDETLGGKGESSVVVLGSCRVRRGRLKNTSINHNSYFEHGSKFYLRQPRSRCGAIEPSGAFRGGGTIYSAAAKYEDMKGERGKALRGKEKSFGSALWKIFFFSVAYPFSLPSFLYYVSPVRSSDEVARHKENECMEIMPPILMHRIRFLVSKPTINWNY